MPLIMGKQDSAFSEQLTEMFQITSSTRTTKLESKKSIEIGKKFSDRLQTFQAIWKVLKRNWNFPCRLEYLYLEKFQTVLNASGESALLPMF